MLIKIVFLAQSLLAVNVMPNNQTCKVILLLDDDPDIHDLVKVVLQHYSISAKLVSFFNIQEALDYTENHAVDLVLLDLCLKVSHDGSKFVINFAQRAREGWLVPPIVILSGRENGEIVDYVSELGATDYLQKPLVPSHLCQVIQKYLNLSKEVSSEILDYACLHID